MIDDKTLAAEFSLKLVANEINKCNPYKFLEKRHEENERKTAILRFHE